MIYKVLLLLALLCLARTRAVEKKSQHVRQQGTPENLAESEDHDDADLNVQPTLWRSWRPLQLLNLDSQRTVTRRDSSLVLSSIRNVPYSGFDDTYYDAMSSARGQSLVHSDSAGSLSARCKPGTVEREIVTLMFNSMLDSIIESWDIIPPPRTDERSQSMAIPKTSSELTVTSKKKKGNANVRPSRTRRSRSKLDVLEAQDQQPVSWFSPPDERAIIRFRNGNLFEGNISMKCMHGEGRFQWTDGTVYLGKFNDNEIKGQGKLFWKDDTWYEGEFVDNLRHGHGLYVDSRKQRMYSGDWHCGTKHGDGVIYYSKTFKNSYNGQWINNVRHGFGSREYSSTSGYRGEWNAYVREGKGLMIWPNHDFYRGDWKNGVMCGYGIYIWDAYYNNSMSLPSVNAFRGNWDRGQRNGYGVLNLGFGLGSHYKGEFQNNKKNGAGKLVTNNGLIIQHQHLFIDDNMGPLLSVKSHGTVIDQKQVQLLEPYKFDICDETVGLLYHIEEALKNIDRQHEIRANILNDYLEINKPMEMEVSHISYVTRKTHPSEVPNNDVKNLKDLIEFEEESLRKALRCYETELKRIYYMYATICNTEEINFKPILIRLYLWQLYFDCKIHEKGLTLVDIDMMFFENPEWLARSPHNPFEKIYFWQFVHSLLTVANRLYAQKQLPGPKPDTILASGFRKFMEKDVLVGAGRRKGRLAKGYASFIPLKSLYCLYRGLGEPHTLRQFLQAIRFPPHCLECPQPELLDASEDAIALGRNAYIYGDDMTFIADDNISLQDNNLSTDYADLILFNFGNLSSKAIVKIFSRIFTGVVTKTKKRIKNLEINMTFYEFFEAFVACAEESIKVKDEELQWREKFANEGTAI